MLKTIIYIHIHQFRMAVASDSGALTPLEVIADLIRKTCSKYNWDKRDSTHKTFLKHLTSFAKDAGFSREELSSSSIFHARNANHSSCIKYTHALPRFQNIPYFIEVGDDNITNVIINRGNAECPIREITEEMMQMLSYLGVVRLYVIGDTLTIPCWTDNIISLELHGSYYGKVIHYLDEHHIPFPKYLLCLIDNTKFKGHYTNWLPNTLITLESSCLELQNLPASLKYYTYTGNETELVLSMAEHLPIGLEQVNYSKNCHALSLPEITMPPRTQELKLGLDRIFNDTLIITNVITLYITGFILIMEFLPRDEQFETSSNLVLEYEQPCGCCKVYRQNVNVILTEGIEHILIILGMSTDILMAIKEAPTSLNRITIYNCKRITELDEFSLEASYADNHYLERSQQTIKDFMHRFPHIEMSIEQNDDISGWDATSIIKLDIY